MKIIIELDSLPPHDHAARDVILTAMRQLFNIRCTVEFVIPGATVKVAGVVNLDESTSQR